MLYKKGFAYIGTIHYCKVFYYPPFVWVWIELKSIIHNYFQYYWLLKLKFITYYVNQTLKSLEPRFIVE